MVNYLFEEITAHNTAHSKYPNEQFLPVEQDAKGRTLLHYFAYYGWEKELLFFTESPTKIEPKKRSLLSSLKFKKDDLQINKITLSPTQKDNSKETLMHFAISGGSLKCIRFLQSKAWNDVQCIRGKYSENAIGTAIVYKRNSLIIPLIEEFKVDITALTVRRETLLILCALLDNWEAFEILLPYFKYQLDSKNHYGQSLVHAAATNGSITFLRHFKVYCQKQGPDWYNTLFHSMTGTGDSILHMVCRKFPLVGVINIFINEFDCHLRQQNNDGDTPLHIGLKMYHDKPNFIWGVVSSVVKLYGRDLLEIRNHKQRCILDIARENGRLHLFDIDQLKKL